MTEQSSNQTDMFMCVSAPENIFMSVANDAISQPIVFC